MQTHVCADPTCQTPPGEVGVSDPRIRGPLMALSGHPTRTDECPLLGVKRT